VGDFTVLVNGSVTNHILTANATHNSLYFTIEFQSTSQVQIHAHAHPVANANGPYTDHEGSPISFDASGSTDMDGDIVLYEWDWDNDGIYDESTTSPSTNHAWTDDYAGTIVLRVTDDDGLNDTDTASVTVNNVVPTVEAGLNRTVYVNQTVSFSASFTDPGTNDVHTIFWDFGDGNNATDTLTPTHNYTKAGVYTVTLNVTDDDGGVGLDTLEITGSTVPVHDVAIFSVTPNATEVIQGSTVNITVVAYTKGTETENFTVTSYYDANVIGTKNVTNLASGSQITLNFTWDTTSASLGNYTIKAEASIVPNETDTADNTLEDGTVKVMKPPVADANGPYSDSEGTPITFDASGSTDVDGTIVLYEWDWDNDSSYDESTTSPTIDHTWFDDYSGTVGLKVTDSDGLSDTATASVTVNNVVPTVEAGGDKSPYVGQNVSFSGNFTDPGTNDTHTIFWDFGDGTNTTGTLTPTHVYTKADVYTVTLNVTDDDGESEVDTLTVTVRPVPVHKQVISVTVDGLDFNVTMESNSTVSNFDFRKDQKEISFNVAGSDDTVGFCNVSIPMDLMKGPWIILVDDVVPTYIFESTNATHTFLYFTYTHTTHNVKIRGTWVVPEFPTLIPLLLILAILAVSTIILKRRPLKTPHH